MSEHDPINTCRASLESGDLRAARAALERARAEVYRLEQVISIREHGKACSWREADNRDRPARHVRDDGEGDER